MRDVEVVVAGHICLDIIPGMEHVAYGKLPALLKPGHLVITGPVHFSTGGPVSNTGLALHRLGVATRLAAKIGADPLGNIVREIVDGIDPSLAGGLVEDPAVSTSYSVILSAPGIDRIFLHCPAANDAFTAADVDVSLLEKARLMHFGYPPVMKQMYANGGSELVELYRRAKQTGVTTSLDMTFPDPEADGGRADWPVILRAVLPYVDVFLPSFEELFFMLHRDEYERLRSEQAEGDVLLGATPELLGRLADELLDMGVRIVAIKLGSRGLYLRTAGEKVLEGMGRGAPPDLGQWAGRTLWAACFKVNVVGTTGSGDATIAGLLSGLLRGLTAQEALMAAVGVGACNVEAADALSGLLSWEDTLARIESGWEHLPLHVEAWGWNEAAPGLWEKRRS